MIEKIVIQTTEKKDGTPISFNVILFAKDRPNYAKNSGCSDVADLARLMAVCEGWRWEGLTEFGTFVNVKTDTYTR